MVGFACWFCFVGFFFFSDSHQSALNCYLLDSVVWYLHFSAFPFSSCQEVLSKWFLAADDKSTACNTFLQLISGKKPDVTAVQFAKPIGVLRFWPYFFDHYRGGGSQHSASDQVRGKKQEPPCWILLKVSLLPFQ